MRMETNPPELDVLTSPLNTAAGPDSPAPGTMRRPLSLTPPITLYIYNMYICIFPVIAVAVAVVGGRGIVVNVVPGVDVGIAVAAIFFWALVFMV